MTAAVGGAAQSGVEVLLQSGPTRAGAGGHKNYVKRSDEAKSESGEAAYQQSPRTEASSSDVPVDGADKVAKHKHGKSKSDDDDTSFEDTFDSIGQDGPKNQASGDQSKTWSPDLAIASMTGSLPVQAKSDIAAKSPEGIQGAVRPAGLLKQNSIVALMNAKSRLFPDSENTKVDIGTTQDATPYSEKTSDPIPVTVNGSETHWNFDNKTAAAVAQQVSALQNGGQVAPHRLSALRASAPAPAPLSSPTAASPKSGEPAPKVAERSTSQAQPQAVSAPEADVQGNPSFSGDQSGADLHGQAMGDPADRRVAKTDSSESIDQILSTGPNSSPSSSQGATPSVTGQIRNSVIDTLAGSAPEAPSPAASTAPQNSQPNPPPVLRTLDLTLSPPDLGTVKLHLSLTSNSLAIEAEASKSSTAKILSDDRGTLERGLKDAGYDLSSLKITDASASGSTSSNNWQTNGSPLRDGDQARSSFGGRQDGDMQRRDGAMSDQAQRRPKDNNGQNSSTEVANGRQGNALYI